MTKRLVVVGGDAGGMAAAAVVRRRQPKVEIVALERGRWTSYAACGIPFVVGGVVDDLDKLVARSPAEFREQGIDVRTHHEVTAIDLDRREVEVWDHDGSAEYKLGFDTLHIGTGARPARPPLPGIDGDHVHGVQTLEDAAHLLEHVQGKVGSVVVVGGGYIGLEMAEAFVERGCPAVTVVESGPQVMPTLDPDMGALVTDALRAKGVTVLLERRVLGFDPGVVVTDDGNLDAEVVVLGIGVEPNSDVAKAAGLATGVKEAIVVDRRQVTSADGVYAAGDCCQSFHLVAQLPVSAGGGGRTVLMQSGKRAVCGVSRRSSRSAGVSRAHSC